MAQHEDLDRFFQRILTQWGKAHGLRTICELTCRNLFLSFGAKKAQLVVAYKSRWKTLLEMKADGIHYQFPPLEIPKDNTIPFYQITKAIRQRHTQVIELDAVRRFLLPIERRSTIIGCLVFDLPRNEKNDKLDSHHFSPLSTLIASELDSYLINASIQDEHSGRRSAERELKISIDEQHNLQQQLQALHDISFKLWRANSVDDMMFIAVDEAKKNLKIDRVAIFIFQDNKRMRGTYGTDIHGNTVDEHYFESAIPNDWFATETLKNKEYFSVQKDTPLYHDFKQVGFGWNGYISLWDEDTPIGWIACDNLLSGMPLHENHYQLLKQFGFIVSQHYVRRQAEEKLRKLNAELEIRVNKRTEELQQANEKLEKISRLDPLTCIANRRVFDEQFAEEWRRAERHQLPLSLLIIDVDHFKLYNDTYGHAAGDQCLKAIAQCLVDLERRAGALFARYGGEEFVLLLPGQDHSAARYAAKRVIHAIQALQIPRTNGAESAPNIVTISVGGGTIIPSSYRSPDHFFEQTDLALYEAKSLGRNQYFMNKNNT
ncbi:GGDEF domain-containing protein [Photobacterium makurazakiensis]|uniref:GGDEF domain-containing protein n=1 Tax=Photobacterium makurazakiensis TaxID=2910234 RepID=UPI003D12D7D1